MSRRLISLQFYPTRQKLSLKGGRNGLRDESTLAEVGLEKGGELTVKDLGPQAEWKTVFIVEYVSFFLSCSCNIDEDEMVHLGWPADHTSTFLLLP